MPVYIEMPKLSDTMTEGTLVKWHVKVGDTIEIGKVIADVETDKATMEMESFEEGTLHQLLIAEGSKVGIGEQLAMLLEDGEEPPKPGKKNPVAKAEAKTSKELEAESKPIKVDQSKKAQSSSVTPTAATGGRIKSSPLARKIATAKGVDLAAVQGTGPGGRILAADVESARANTAATSTSSATAAPAPIKLDSSAGASETIPLSGMRRVIAERLLASKTQIPHFYLHIEVDAGPIGRLRRQLNQISDGEGRGKITINDFILLATARAAAAHPKVNASFAGDSVVQYADVNLAVAVAVDDGLVTPVLRVAQNLTLKQISEGVKDLATRARSKKLKPDEYAGGTITVSNLGAYGIERFAAIINPPQSAILAVGAIVKKPVVNDKDEIVVGERMSISLSCDHRVIDGAVGAEYLSTLRRLVENPALMLF